MCVLTKRERNGVIDYVDAKADDMQEHFNCRSSFHLTIAILTHLVNLSLEFSFHFHQSIACTSVLTLKALGFQLKVATGGGDFTPPPIDLENRNS